MMAAPHRTPIIARVIPGIFLIIVVFTASVGARESVWTHSAGDAANSGVARRAPADLGTVAWSATPETAPGLLEQFVWRGGVVTAGNRVFITGRRYFDDGSGIVEHTDNIVICFDGANGERLWDTLIDADSFGYDSWSTPVLDLSHQTIIVASHFTLFALDMETGDLVWERELPQVLVNASPTVSSGLTSHGVPADRVFMTDYTGFASTGGGIYAINVSPFDSEANPYEQGEIVWQDRSLPGTSGNTVAYADGFVYVASTHGGVIRCYRAVDGGTDGILGEHEWETDTGVSKLAQFAGFYGGLTVNSDHVYVAAYTFYGVGNSSRMYKLRSDDGELVWEIPCERTDSIPVVTDDGRIYLSAGIDGFGSAVKIQAFQDQGKFATQLWDSFVDTSGELIVGGWTHQPIVADGMLFCGTPDNAQFFAPYTDLYILDTSFYPGHPDFIVDNATGGGGSPAVLDRFVYTLGSAGLVAYRGCGGADMNNDGESELIDFAAWELCMSGPQEDTQPANCETHAFRCADLDGDGDVDMQDFGMFEHAFESDMNP
ncbi:MAG: PQQ-binding-like beta-propeller repeat protein [Phycisphaerae bacterium]